ncbi:hypothetical protein LNTAR_16368 [Lentisphaera araneosa HTCC2155]|uniref:Uncharacterized protein n=1 Tax=Lentisphaera araneosa HTCC2155 TaxID=313628 RepID=A6DQ88_9BACT|nr:hypothetical protein [Lentisphaera araneosa]EDM26139.1 hypothetical protein LNTAR_16368 [Lentisphaera araneosa HTCC2155]
MLKINISFSKKVPGQEQYSSNSFYGSLEKDIPENLSNHEVQQAFRDAYELLENTVEQEIAHYANKQNIPLKHPVAPQVNSTLATQNAKSGRQYSGVQNTPSQISQKQATFLNRLGAERGLSQEQVDAMALNQFGVESIWKISKKQASQLIEQLQNQRAA